MKKIFMFLLLILTVISFSFSDILIDTKDENHFKAFNIEAENYNLKIILKNGKLLKEIVSDKSGKNGLTSDGNFKINLMWTGWHAPGVLNNSENPVGYDSSFFIFKDYTIDKEKDRTILKLNFKGKLWIPLKLSLIYKFFNNKYYYKRKVEISRIKRGNHFLRKIFPVFYKVENKDLRIIKSGSYGQPLAFLSNDKGYFLGLEYPSSYNKIFKNHNFYKIKCYQYIGEKILDKPISSDWVVMGISPDKDVKKRFFDYLNDIRVAKPKPYVLYNSWYDLEAPEMVKNKKNIMNEENILRIYELFKKIMMRKYKLKLDAFVLDDGWDVYKSDWQLSKEQFPNGLKPVTEKLKKDGVSLGIWFGPIGGYSHRDWRLEWMKKNGYETVGDQLCFGGKKYNTLFKQRVEDFVKDDGVGYYKWDGFQFSCSEPDHGHPVGIYSRRYILNKLIGISDAVRKLNPDIFLNITSGTWLSPWWLKIANQIWMQGYDYGYAGVPSISKRDMAMTYRDYVLYDDFKNKKFWFPIANLMTHGIIKGDLQKLGGDKEPIDKFTNNAVLYFTRGISMYELYITPDLLSENEWKAIADSIKWAKENFAILSNYTEMIGGNPGEKQAYGYLHFKGKNGIIVVRNPYIENTLIEFTLKTEYSIDKTAKNLVLEKIYPKRWISPKLYKTGDKIRLKLLPYETAVYKIYPIKEAKNVLISNIVYSEKRLNSRKEILFVYKTTGKPEILNNEKLEYIIEKGEKQNKVVLNIPESSEKRCIKVTREEDKTILEVKIDGTFINPELAILLTSKKKKLRKHFPAKIIFKIDEKDVKPRSINNRGWGWFKTGLKKGEYNIEVSVKKPDNWKGKMKIYLIYYKNLRPYMLTIKSKNKTENSRKLPKPYPANFFKITQKIGVFDIE